nr:hypothetical protein [Tanacetum cinerariifolium]
MDIQKAYDTVNWRFLGFILKCFCFHHTMIKWIMACVKSPSFSICISGDIHGSSKASGVYVKVTGLVPSNPKSATFFCNVVNHVKISILNVMPFLEGELPVKYLGVPLISSRLPNKDCKVFVEKARNRISDWKNKSLSFAGSIPFTQKRHTIAYMGFLWCNGEYKRGKAKVAWDDICLPKREGGLGIRCLKVFNLALMTTNIWNIVSNKESLWVRWIHMYKLKGRTFWDISPKAFMSWGWRKILQLRDIVKPFFWMQVENGLTASLWYDTWYNQSPLSNFISPRDIAREGHHLRMCVADIISNGDWEWLKRATKGSESSDSEPDMSFDTSASPEYVSGLGRASLVHVISNISPSVVPGETIAHHDTITSAPVWVKIHHVPIVAYSEVGLSLITSQLGRPIMLDAYTSTMFHKSWGRNTYARALIEPPRCDSCKIFDHNDVDCTKREKVVVPDQVVDDEGFTHVTRKNRKGKQNSRPRQVVGIKLTKPKPNIQYRVFRGLNTKEKNISDNMPTTNDNKEGEVNVPHIVPKQLNNLVNSKDPGDDDEEEVEDISTNFIALRGQALLVIMLIMYNLASQSIRGMNQSPKQTEVRQRHSGGFPGDLSPGKRRWGRLVRDSFPGDNPRRKATIPGNPGRLVAEDRFPGRHVARETSNGKARMGYLLGRYSRATTPGPHSFSHTIKCH